MPTKGKYLLNEDEEWKSRDSRYEQFHHMSQHYPLMLIFLSIAIIFSAILIILAFIHGWEEQTPDQERMPTKGKYLLNEDEEWKSRDSRYEQFHHMSQHYPLMLIFLSIAIIFSVILIILRL